MADVNLPSFSDLSQMQFMAPLQRQAAAQQIDLANQFQQQNLNLGDADLQAKLLSNDYSRQADPLRVQQLTLNNTGLGYGNTKSRVEAENMAANQPDLADAAKWEARKKATDAQLEYMQSTAGKMMYSDDPATRAQGNELWQRSQKFQEQKIKDENEVKKYQAMGGFRLQQEEKKQEGANQRSQAEIDAKLKMNSDKMAALNAKTAQAKDPKTYQEAAAAARTHANNTNDPTENARWNAIAADFDNRAQIFAQSLAGTKADVGALGLQKNNVQMPPPIQWSPPPAQSAPIPQGSSPGQTRGTPEQQVPPAAQAVRESDAVAVLQAELPKAVARLQTATTPEDRARAESDIRGIQTELGRFQKGTQAPNAKPVAGAAAPAGQTKPPSSPASLPQGSKLIGTSGGKPVYETPDGQRFLGK